MRFIGWTLTLVLTVAGFAQASLNATVNNFAPYIQNTTLSQIPAIKTVTVTNYVTPLCFAQAIKSVDNGENAQLGIPLVLVWGGDKASVSVSVSVPANDLTVTKRATLYETKIVPCTITTDVTVTKTATNCGANKCVEVVSTIVLPFTYVTLTQSVAAVTTSPSKAGSGKIDEYESDESDSLLDVKEQCKCKVAEFVMKYETVITSVIYLATYTPPVTLAVSPLETVQPTKPNPVHTDQPVTTGSTISVNNSWNVNDVLGSAKAESLGSAEAESTLVTTTPSSSASFSAYTNGTIIEEPVKSTESKTSATTTSTSSTTTSLTVPAATFGSAPTCNVLSDIFTPISNEDPKKYFQAGQLPLTPPNSVTNDGVPFQTNKFHGNFMLGDRNEMVWTFPYGFYWDQKDKYGFGVMHTDVKARTYGDIDSNGAVSRYGNPVKQGELIFSATSIESGNQLYMDEMTEMSARVKLMAASAGPNDYIEFPLVKGMGFATAIYHGSLTVRISSSYAITEIVKEIVNPANDLLDKYRVTLNSGTSWLLFVTKPKSSSFSLTKLGNDIVGSGTQDGVLIQAAVAPSDTNLDNFYYESAGYYVTSGSLQGSVSCDTVSHSIVYTGTGNSIRGMPIIFALPHHIPTLTPETYTGLTGIQLASTTKGMMTAFVANSLSFANTIDTNIQFLPYRLGFGFQVKYTPQQLRALSIAAASDLDGVDIAATIKQQGSMYYMGKVVDKYAYILMVVNDILEDDDLTEQLMNGMKSFFNDLSTNNIEYPLMYDTVYGGVTSTANNKGDLNAEFGAGYYNDHHFHYGYHIHAAAVLGYIDKKHGGTWAQDNKGWVNALVRDVANPSTADNYFPVLRNFDWFHGHLFAKGLFASADGKDEESSSEDYNFSYGMKLWGRVIGDKAMEARGDLMLKIQSDAMNLYFLYLDNNKVQPANLIANKVSGIYFENKIDYTTYFGTLPQYIHGIQMLPITPASSLIRGEEFVEQEWNSILSPIVGGITDGWAGILRLNQALFDAASSYLFFKSSGFSKLYLDAGQSWTWSLAFSAAIANGRV